jgi:NACalpha-BTF3-like transcription factor
MLPEGVTEEDINFTMQKHGLSREEVLQRLGGQ